MYESGKKLDAREVAYAQSIVTQEEQLYPSITICPYYFPFWGPDGVTNMSSNMTRIYEANKFLKDMLIRVDHGYEKGNM